MNEFLLEKHENKLKYLGSLSIEEAAKSIICMKRYSLDWVKNFVKTYDNQFEIQTFLTQHGIDTPNLPDLPKQFHIAYYPQGKVDEWLKPRNLMLCKFFELLQIKVDVSVCKAPYAGAVMRQFERGVITEWERPFRVQQLKPSRNSMLRCWLSDRVDGWAKYAKLGDSLAIGKSLSLQFVVGNVTTRLQLEKGRNIRYVKFLKWQKER